MQGFGSEQGHNAWCAEVSCVYGFFFMFFEEEVELGNFLGGERDAHAGFGL